jgi:hypothetical protein
VVICYQQGDCTHLVGSPSEDAVGRQCVRNVR